MRITLIALLALPLPLVAQSLDGRRVYLQSTEGLQVHIATLEGEDTGYSVSLNDGVFSDHFLSMRPFKCIDGPDKTWCHVPYPYDIKRDISEALTDLEYDFLFVWKDRTDYGIDMWNGVYYRLNRDGEGFLGAMHEVNMDILAAPPAPGVIRPIKESDLEPAEPESHWLPYLVIR